MSRIRLLKTSSVYPQHADFFHSTHPELCHQPYAQQLETMLSDSVGFGGAWKYYLEDLGQFEVMEVVSNLEPAQKRWAQERGLRYSEAHWKEEIMAAQMEEFKPDIWFCHDPIAPALRLSLRRRVPSIRFVIGYDGALMHHPEYLAGCDAVLTCVRESAAFYTKARMGGYWMPWGFDPRVLGRLATGAQKYSVTFSGSLVMQQKVRHFGRLQLLHRLAREFEINVFCPNLAGRSMERLFVSHLRQGHFELAARMALAYPAIRSLRRVNGGARFGFPMLQLLADSSITLNTHGDSGGTAANIRLFEVTGVGSCLLTDWKEDLPALFEPDREVMVYRNPEDCADKVRYLLEHPEARRAVAEAGQKRCLRDHHLGNHIMTFAKDVLLKL